MKRIALYLTALLVVASACNNKQTVRDEDDADDLEFRVVSYTSPDSTFTYEIEAPVEGGTMLADSILNYIWESLGTEFRDRYNGDNIEETILSGASALYEARQQEIESFREDIDDEDSFMLNWENSTSISKYVETDEFITFLYNSYEYSGGAHGMSYLIGTTFLKDTGERLDASIIKDPSNPDFQALFKEKLYAYFNDEEGGTLGDYLLYQSEDDDIPLSNMFLRDSSVVFNYQPYEISFYAAGMPEAVFSFSEIKPYLTKKAIKALDLDDDEVDEEDED